MSKNKSMLWEVFPLCLHGSCCPVKKRQNDCIGFSALSPSIWFKVIEEEFFKVLIHTDKENCKGYYSRGDSSGVFRRRRVSSFTEGRELPPNAGKREADRHPFAPHAISGRLNVWKHWAPGREGARRGSLPHPASSGHCIILCTLIPTL